MLEKKISETTFITKICIIHMVYKIHKLNLTGSPPQMKPIKEGRHNWNYRVVTGDH